MNETIEIVSAIRATCGRLLPQLLVLGLFAVPMGCTQSVDIAGDGSGADTCVKGLRGISEAAQLIPRDVFGWKPAGQQRSPVLPPHRQQRILVRSGSKCTAVDGGVAIVGTIFKGYNVRVKIVQIIMTYHPSQRQ